METGATPVLRAAITFNDIVPVWISRHCADDIAGRIHRLSRATPPVLFPVARFDRQTPPDDRSKKPAPSEFPRAKAAAAVREWPRRSSRKPDDPAPPR